VFFRQIEKPAVDENAVAEDYRRLASRFPGESKSFNGKLESFFSHHPMLLAGDIFAAGSGVRSRGNQQLDAEDE
jgi:hypothetical protein